MRTYHNPTNGVPGAPVVLSPSSGTANFDGKPVLIVLNAVEPDGGEQAAPSVGLLHGG